MVREICRHLVQAFRAQLAVVMTSFAANSRGQRPCIWCEHANKHFPRRLLADVPKVDFHVDTSGSNQSIIEPLWLVGGHDHDATLLRANSVQNIQQAGQSTVGSGSVAARGSRSIFSFREITIRGPDGVDVLKEDDALRGYLLKHLL